MEAITFSLLSVLLDWLLDHPQRHPPPRATCLPLAQQQDLVLAVTALLNSPEQQQQQQPNTALRTQLLQLLVAVEQHTLPSHPSQQHINSSSGHSSSSTSTRHAYQAAPNSLQQTVAWALQQQHPQGLLALQGALSSLQSLNHQQQPASLPSWLTPSAHHCCSWLQEESHQAAVPPTLAVAAAAAAATGAAAVGVSAPADQHGNGATATPAAPAAGGGGTFSRKETIAGTAQQQQQGDPLQAQAASPPAAAATAPAAPTGAAVGEGTGLLAAQPAEDEAQGGSAEAPAAKRARHAHLHEASPPAACTVQQQQQQQAQPAAAASAWQQGLAALQAFASSGDASSLDIPAVMSLLSATAAAADMAALPQIQVQREVQELLQQLPVDACQLLLEEVLPQLLLLLPPAQPSALEYLLTAALLPKVMALEAAAPVSLLACCTAFARSSACDVLCSSLLAPLVMNACLKLVHVQLLVKLLKEVQELQPRVLQLLLAAALGQQRLGQQQGQQAAAAPAAFFAAAPAAGGGGSSSSGAFGCCWREPHVTLFKALLDAAPAVVAPQLPAVLAALEVAVQQPLLAKSTAFGQLLLALLKSFGAGALSQRQLGQLQGVVGRTSMFLTKTLSSRLQQLQGHGV